MFSVVMAAYNAEKYVREAIDGILGQTFCEFELIIVDDGSRDNTLTIAREYEAKDARVRVIAKEKNSGIAETCNVGVEAARYDWIANHDSDDIAHPEWLQTMKEAIATNPAVVGWSCANRLMSVDGRHMGVSTLGPCSVAEFEDMRRNGIPVYVSHPGFVFRRDIWDKAGRYQKEGTVVCDLDLMDRMSDHGILLCYPVERMYYRIHSGSVSQSKFASNALSLRYIFYRREKLTMKLPAPSYDEFLRFYHAQSPMKRFEWWRIDRSRMYRTQLPELIGRKQYMRAGINVALAAIYHPGWVADKVMRQFKRRARLSPST